MRMVAVSATLPNVQDIATFLEAPPECTFFFGPEFRPVPLKVVVKGCGRNSNEFFFDKVRTARSEARGAEELNLHHF